MNIFLWSRKSDGASCSVAFCYGQVQLDLIFSIPIIRLYVNRYPIRKMNLNNRRIDSLCAIKLIGFEPGHIFFAARFDG